MKQTIGIINPSLMIKPFTPKRFDRAVKFLQDNGYILKFGKLSENVSEIYRSGTIKERVEEIHELVLDSSIDIIMVSIGGQNSASLIDRLDYELLKKHPKKYVGYSDATSILNAIHVKTDLEVYYGMSLTSTFGEIGYFSQQSLRNFEQVINGIEKTKYLNNEYVTNQYIDWEEQIHEKTKYPNVIQTYNFHPFSGRIIGGNLATLCAICGTEYIIKRHKNDILYLETEGTDIGMVEKYLVQLNQNEYFNDLSGLILGKIEFIKDYGLNRNLVDLINEIIPNFNVPIYDGFDAAHTNPSTLIKMGAQVEVKNKNEISIDLSNKC